MNIADVYTVKFPFVRSSYVDWSDGEGIEVKFWQPGTRVEMVYPDDTELFADGEGKMVLKVISIHKPGKYPERIFYTRKFIDPDGKFFGKGNLHIAVVSKFRRLAESYYYDYTVDDIGENHA